MSLEERRWLLGPSVPDAVRLQIAVDPKAKLTPDICRALEYLALELEKGLLYQAKPINCTGVEIGECNILVNCPSVSFSA